MALDSEALQEILVKAGSALESAEPVIASLAKVELCDKRPVCWRARRTAANIVIKLITQASTGRKPPLKSIAAVLGDCPWEPLVNYFATERVRKEVEHEYCPPRACDLNCMCIAVPLRLTLGHVHRRDDVYTDPGRQPLPGPGNAAICQAIVDVDFDIQLVLEIGVCLKK